MINKVFNKLKWFVAYLKKHLLRRRRYFMNPQKFWNKVGAKSTFEDYPDYIQRSQEKFFKKIDSELKPSSVLEVGCGHGRLLKIFGDRGAGVDFGESQIERAKNAGLNVVLADAMKLPFPDNSFDIVYTNCVLMHILPKHIDEVRNEIIRVSKKWILHCEALNITPIMFGYNHAEWYRNVAQKKKLRVVREVYNPFLRKNLHKRVQVILVEKNK